MDLGRTSPFHRVQRWFLLVDILQVKMWVIGTEMIIIRGSIHLIRHNPLHRLNSLHVSRLHNDFIHSSCVSHQMHLMTVWISTSKRVPMHLCIRVRIPTDWSCLDPLQSLSCCHLHPVLYIVLDVSNSVQMCGNPEAVAGRLCPLALHSFWRNSWNLLIKPKTSWSDSWSIWKRFTQSTIFSAGAKLKRPCSSSGLAITEISNSDSSNSVFIYQFIHSWS